MKVRESGIVLFTERYEQAVAFYEQRLGLSVREKQDNLTVFAWGASYLMVESGGVAAPLEKDRAHNPTVLRLDVLDIEQTVADLIQQGVQVSLASYDWGRIAAFTDPEGNRIELKDANFQSKNQ